MKQLSLLITAVLLSSISRSQQTFTAILEKYIAPQAAIAAKDGNPAVPAKPGVRPKTLKLYGIGNLNTETLNKVNSSGKIALSIIPYFNTSNSRYWELYLSFNKNATNRDSILASTVLFPEVGNHSFLATVRKVFPIKGSKEHFLSPFFEFSQKNIKVDTTASQGKNTSGFFSTLTYTLGGSYIFNTSVNNTPFGFSFSPYLSVMNVPDEDNEDYRKIFKSPTLPSALWSAGVKIIFQIKGFQVFADLRHLWGSESKIPLRELRGFNSNIGMTFNADIFEL